MSALSYLKTVAHRQRRDRFVCLILPPCSIFVFLRIWDSTWAYVVSSIMPAPRIASNLLYGLRPITDGIAGVLWGPWLRWDTVWYIKIAESGYSSTDLSPAYFFLYPLLIKALSSIIGNSVAAGVVLSSGAALVGFALLYRLVQTLYDEAVARRTLLFFALFPTAFFLFAAYTEAVFFALALGAIMAALARRWELVGIYGSLAAMTRPQGLAFVLPMAVEFGLQYRAGQVLLRRAWTLGLVAVGALSPFFYLTLRYGTPRVWFDAQALWHRLSWPWESVGAAWGAVLTAPSPLEAVISFPDAFFAVSFLSLLVWSFVRLSPTLSAYMAIIVLPPLFGMTTYSPVYPLASMSRYVLLAFPAFILLGKLPPSWWQPIVLVFSFLLQTLWLILFVAWVFVG